jgi:hypothetical protein
MDVTQNKERSDYVLWEGPSHRIRSETTIFYGEDPCGLAASARVDVD